MTEDEAKTKWCPAYRVATSGGEVTSTYEMDNRPMRYEPQEPDPAGGLPKPIGLHEFGCCIGSSCMAWRWNKVPNPAWSPSQQSMISYPAANVYSRVPEGIDSTTDGYCGLAR